MIYLSLVKYVVHRFLTGICVIYSKIVQRNCFLFKKPLTLLCSLCKLYHETDCHLFDEYKDKKPLRNQP